MHKHTRAGHHYLTKVAEAYYTVVGLEVRNLAANVRLDGKLLVRCVMYPPDRRRRDLDNAWKVVSDACTRAGVWLDDTQIDHLQLLRAEVRSGGMVQVEVSVLGPTGAMSA